MRARWVWGHVENMTQQFFSHSPARQRRDWHIAQENCAFTSCLITFVLVFQYDLAFAFLVEMTTKYHVCCFFFIHIFI